MLIILLFFVLFRMLQGVPLNAPAEAPDGFVDFSLREAAGTHLGLRTPQDIFTSCLATIFACAWSTIHPNIPPVTDCWWTRFRHQVEFMIFAFLFPEGMVVLALVERMDARKVREEYNREILGDSFDPSTESSSLYNSVKKLFQDSPKPAPSSRGPSWTLTHGFFLRMGGFMLADKGSPIKILSDSKSPQTPKERQLIYNIKEEIISPPQITEDDIQDRSKGDAISKSIAVVQTTWFVVNCIARWSQHLPVTEIEVFTLGFAVLNGITYALWWYKPQNVTRPVFLEQEKIPVVATIHSAPPPSASEPGPQRKPNLTQRLERLSKGSYAILGLTPNEGPAVGEPTPHVTATSIGATCTAILFGIVHLIPSWFLDFSSPKEKWLWRASAIISAATPIWGCAYYFSTKYTFTTFIMLIPGEICICLYLPARFVLLVLSFKSLRSLDPAALQDIDWTTFIPHF